MNGPTMQAARQVAPDTTQLGAWLPVPGFGVLPVNAYLIKSRQPVLIDTGLAGLGEAFMQSLEQAIDPPDLRWIWITHADPDHLGNLQAVLATAPEARVVTTYLGMGKMGMLGLPPERMLLLNPGQKLELGDRSLLAVTPPTFDAPETCGVFDPHSRSLFSADCFGALMQAPAETAGAISTNDLYEGCLGWASVDAPWLQMIDTEKFARKLAMIRKLDADTVLSAHLPPAYDMVDLLLDYLAHAPLAPPFVGPDQATLEQMLAA